jgi:hypothetical protein
MNLETLILRLRRGIKKYARGVKNRGRPAVCTWQCTYIWLAFSSTINSIHYLILFYFANAQLAMSLGQYQLNDRP